MSRRPAAPPLDATDRAILRLLQQDNTLPHRLIGERVHLSTPSVQRRVAALERAGVIAAQVAVVDPASVGQALTVLVEVHLVSDQAGVVDAAKAAFSRAAEVQQCYYVAGNGGLVLVVLVADMAAYQALARRLFADNPQVATFRSLVVLDRVKVGLGVPL